MIFGPNLIEEAEATVSRIQDNLRAAKSHQESYANKRRRPLEFDVGSHVHLKVSPMKGMKRFGVKWKLAPQYIGPFPIPEKCGNMAYKLELSPSLAGVHNIFHVSQCCQPKPTDGRRQATREPGGPEPLSVSPAARTHPEVHVRWACHLTYTWSGRCLMCFS
jgi:hypothetical protein